MRRYLNYIGGGEVLLYFLIVIGIGLLISVLIGAKVPKFRQDKKRFLLYILLQGLSFLIVGAILYNLKNTTLSIRSITLQLYMAVAGAVHLMAFRHYFRRFESKAIYKELLICVASAVFLSAFILLVGGFFGESNYLLFHVASIVWFLVPTLTYSLFETAVSIPAKLHKRWFYPTNSKYPAPQVSDMRNVIILNFIFQKKADDTQIINFKVKAPRGFEFGKLFYYFINDYNEKNPNSQIHYLDKGNQPHGWYFYSKPKWFGTSMYIDPDLAVDTNNIKDGATIICQRI
ncbi:MAG TPA: TssN family type VI secretion system protein [Flavobacterium sp.]|jgi:hypothetical protein